MTVLASKPRKKLIEVALPLEAINLASAREKSIRHGHPSTLHLWWARRPLAACRAVIFASLVDDPDSPDALPAFVEACRVLPYIGKNVHTNGDTPRMRLFDFIERLVQWESTTDEAVLNDARRLIQIATEGNPPPLLDPFAGGGSIPLEAQRLGLEAHASDLNPVAVMINKAQIEIPPRFANQPPVNPRDRERMSSGEGWKGASGLAADVRYYGEWMREKAWERIGHLYPTCNGETVIAWLWARTVKCPNPACGAQMPLVTSFELSKKPGRRAWVEPIIDKATKLIRFEVKHGDGKPPEPTKAGRGSKFRCLVCGETVQDQYLKDEGIAKRISAQLMAIVTDGRGARNYHAPNREHEQAALQAHPDWYPSGEFANDRRSFSPPIYGFMGFADAFTARQLVALTTFSELLAEARNQVNQDAVAAGLSVNNLSLNDGGNSAQAYSEAISVYLAFAVDKAANFWNSLCPWLNQPKNELVGNAFGRQALAMVWDFAEANPFSYSGGNFIDNFDWIVKATERVPAEGKGTVIQQDAAQSIRTNKFMLSTDPPYYDMVGYADLSDFFYVWMRRNLREVYPDLFGTMLVPKEPELIASPYRHGSKEAATKHFESGLFHTFQNMRRFITTEYPLTVYYAFKQQDAEAVDEDGYGDKSDGYPTGHHSKCNLNWLGNHANQLD